MKITVARQRNAVSEGIALGLLMCGRGSIPTNRFSVDLAFEDAWSAWPHRRMFPQVDTDVRNGLNGSIVMTRADERKQVLNLYWADGDREHVIHVRGYWPNNELDAAQVARSIDGHLPATAWKELAADFLQHLDKG